MALAIALKPPGAPWVQIGEVGSPRVIPHSLSLTSDDGGPLSGSFLLTARPSDPLPALETFSPVRIEIDGLRVWSGFGRTAPRTGRQVAVELAGTQAHLDGDLLVTDLADSSLANWTDTLATAGNWCSEGQIQVGAQSIVLSWPSSSATVNSAASEFLGVTYTAALHQVVAVRVTASFAQSIGARFVVVGHDGLAVPSVGGALRIIDVPDTASGIFTGDTGGLFFRFISMGYTGMPGTIPNGTILTIPAVTLFDRAAYLSGLVGSTVAKRIRPLIAQLSPDESQIKTTSFPISHIARTDGDTARSVLQEAAAYDDSLVQVDPSDRLVFTPRSLSAAVELGHACPPLSEAPSDPTNLASAVDVLGQDPGGNPVRRRYAITDDPLATVRPAGIAPANPDFLVGTASWAVSSQTGLARGTASPPPGFSSWALITNASNPGVLTWPIEELVLGNLIGTFLAGNPYRLDLWMFDASTPLGGTVLKAPTVTLRVCDQNDTQGMVETTLRLPQGTSAPYPWQKFSVTWVPRFDTASAYVQIYNSPLISSFPDGAIAGLGNFPTFTGVRVYTADSLLTRQRVKRVGSIQVPVLSSEDAARAIGVSFLKDRARLGYTGTRDCPDGSAKDARTHAPLPAAALLGMTGRLARIADRLDPATGAVGARAYVSGVTYDHATRRAQVTLGQRYAAAETLVAELTP